jgi:hypothetical protein
LSDELPTKPKKQRMPVFEPSAEQRKIVWSLAGFQLTHTQLASLTFNPRTGKPISEMTLRKAFKQELAVAKTRVQQTILQKYFEALEAGTPWAVQWGLKFYCGYREDATISIAAGDSPDVNRTIVVVGVTPTKRPDDEGPPGFYYPGRDPDPPIPPRLTGPNVLDFKKT